MKVALYSTGICGCYYALPFEYHHVDLSRRESYMRNGDAMRKRLRFYLLVLSAHMARRQELGPFRSYCT